MNSPFMEEYTDCPRDYLYQENFSFFTVLFVEDVTLLI